MQIVPDKLTHERVALFIDYHNTHHALRRLGRQIDLVALRDYLTEGRHLLEAFVYIATHPDPNRSLEDEGRHQELRQHGFLIRTKTGQMLPDGRLKCDLDLEMALDIQEFASITRPDIVVLVTGDGDFASLARRLRFQGIRVEVASAAGCISGALRAMSNGFIDLARLEEEVDNVVMPYPEGEETDVYVWAN